MKIDRGQVTVLSTGGARQILMAGRSDPIRQSLRSDLTAAGFFVTTFPDGKAVLDYLAIGRRADLILLDWLKDGLKGVEVVRRLRDRGDLIPVIFLTDPSDRVTEEAACLGDDVEFVDKSRSFAILRRRIDLLIEGPNHSFSGGLQTASGDRIRVGRLELNPSVGRAYWGGAEVNLTLTEFRIVDNLARRSGRDMRYREIYNLVHGEGFVAGIGDEGYRANVRAFIKRIRRKFRDIDPEFGCIENYRGFGYRWRSNV